MGLAEKIVRPTVLIIDDDQSTRMMATQFLSQAGFTVKEAADGNHALQVIDNVNPDLILLDVEMPEMNGFELCRTLRNQPAYALTPILMLTGLNNNEAIEIAYEVGATDFATKPINWSLLCHRLKYMYRSSMAASELLQSQASLSAAQRIAQLGNWGYDFETKRLICSDQLYLIFGERPENNNATTEYLLQRIHPNDKARVRDWFNQAKHSPQALTIDHRIIQSDGNIRHIRQQIEQVFDAEQKLIKLHGTVQDYTERRLAESKIHQLAFYDALTGLANRILFRDKLRKAVVAANEKTHQLAVIYFDLDDFKRVNDTFGHSIGDKLIQSVGKRLLKELQSLEDSGQAGYGSSTLARMGGDEFTLLLDNIDNKQSVTSVAEHIIERFTKPFKFDEYELFTTPSLGISLFPNDGDTVDTLLKSADMAMYEAKRAGKNAFKFHTLDRDTEVLRQHKIAERMRTALQDDNFKVFFQPQLDLTTGYITSAEALLRWSDDELGNVSPQEFIPIAEETGLIVALGEWVLRSSCLQAKQWADKGFGIQKVAVNISLIQFGQAGFSELIQTVLDETKLNACQLELEITESVLAVDLTHTISTLKSLKALGVTLSIDDFGTGYSSLSHLKNFPIDQLKIDQSFIRNVTENNDDAAITRAVIAMANSMNIRVLAEGVETLEHLDFLRENCCDEIQGYFISRPMSAADLEYSMPDVDQLLDSLFENRGATPQIKAV